MTQLEKDKELDEIFGRKKALTEKIEYNTALLLKYEAIGDEDMVERGKRILNTHVEARNKLNHKTIAKNLGLHERQVRFLYRQFVKKPKSGCMGLKFDQQQKVLSAVARSRANDERGFF